MFGRPIGKYKRLARYARPASLSARGVVYYGNGYAGTPEQRGVAHVFSYSKKIISILLGLGKYY